MDGGSKLGLMIRGGAENGLGIYITGVDSNCVAEQAGLKVCETEIKVELIKLCNNETSVSALLIFYEL